MGLLKLRKFTWLTFPIVTLFVTGLTVWVTNQFMSSAEARRAVIVRDVIDDGTIARTNRFELLFVSSSRRAKTNVTKGIFSALEVGASMDLQQRQFAMMQQGIAQLRAPRRPGYGMSESSDVKLLTKYDCRIPTDYTATQELSKWTPQLNRIFSLPGPADESAPVDWKGLTAGLLYKNEQFVPTFVELMTRVQRQFGKEAMVAIIGPRGIWLYDRAPGWTAQYDERDPQGTDRRHQAIRMAAQGFSQDGEFTGGALPQDVAQSGELLRWLYLHSVTTPRGLFGLTTSVGPKGGAHLDDLPIYDTSRPDQALLLVVVPTQDDYVIYRKLVPVETR